MYMEERKKERKKEVNGMKRKETKVNMREKSTERVVGGKKESNKN